MPVAAAAATLGPPKPSGKEKRSLAAADAQSAHGRRSGKVLQSSGEGVTSFNRDRGDVNAVVKGEI